MDQSQKLQAAVATIQRSSNELEQEGSSKPRKMAAKRGAQTCSNRSLVTNDDLFALGNDAAGQVLLRLPLKHLFRFKSVSKRWLDVISDPSFARSKSGMVVPFSGVLYQLNLNQVYHGPFGGRRVHFVPDHHSDAATAFNEDISTMRINGLSVDFADSHKELLLCCDNRVFPKEYYVCNPLTRLCVHIPTPPKVKPLATAKLFCEEDHFRVIHVKYNKELEMQIFYSERGEWKPVTWAVPRQVNFHMRQCPTIARKTMYWIEKDSIFAYNIEEERFYLLGLPEKCEDSKQGCLWASNGSLYYAENIKRMLSIWVLMGEGGEDAEWALEHIIDVSLIIKTNVGVFQYIKKYEEIIFSSKITALQFLPLALHHMNPNVVFVKLPRRIAVLDIEKGTVNVVCDGDVDWLGPYSDDVHGLNIVRGTWIFPFEQQAWPRKMPTVKNASLPTYY